MLYGEAYHEQSGIAQDNDDLIFTLKSLPPAEVLFHVV
jgi:hypothetical protein